MSADSEAARLGGPLYIDSLGTPLGGEFGMTHCPGRRGLDGAGRNWTRHLEADLSAIEAWGADIVVSLVESREFEKLGVPHLPNLASRRNFVWQHVPIRDMQIPDEFALASWRGAEPLVLETLGRGGKVLFHCAAGLGRTGTIVARLLAELGLGPDEAIVQVRTCRPGTIETDEQLAFVRNGRPFLSRSAAAEMRKRD